MMKPTTAFSRFLRALLGVVGAMILAPLTFGQVEARLVAAHSSIEPGEPVPVALRLEHAAHWHTYWIEAGTGYPTSLVWNLPEGWTATEILWPTPKVVRDTAGTITGNGFEDVVYLPVMLTPPADLAAGKEVTLRVTADWLMCKDVCMPGNANLSLTLPVRAEAPAVAPAVGAEVLATIARLPRGVPGFTVAAAREGDVLLLALDRDPGAQEFPPDLWFFSDDAFVQYSEAQVEREREATRLVLALTVGEMYFGEGERLTGVLRTSGSWAEGESLPGLRIDVPLAESLPGVAMAAAASGETAGGSPLVVTLLLAFLGGIILNLMPCVFPVLGVKIMGFVQQAGSDRRKVALHGLVFSAGVLASFWALAGTLAVLRAGGDQLGWGFQLQSPAFVFILAVVMLVFGLAMSGVCEVGLGATGVGASLQSRQGFAGSFFTGVLATVVATPCSAPFLAPALGAALALPLVSSFFVFTAIAVGLSLPYLLLSLFPGAIRVLPRPGAWMETFKQAMAFPLYATVAYLVWVLAGQVEAGAFLSLLFALPVIAAGVWFYGRYAAPGAKPWRARAGVIGGLALGAMGLFLGWPSAPKATDLVWETWSPEAVSAARAAGRPVYVDFTARWCATCQTNKKIVFASEEVRERFRAHGIAALHADWTNRDPAITAALAAWGRSAVPFNLLYLPGAETPVVLPELLTPGIVLEALEPLD
jgi:thiol:disulfide interchange protein/DsbC/DsbD-like thiol-disulfide interchange protein